MYATHNSLSISTREKMIQILQMRLLDCVDLFTQAKQARWNVKGPQFVGMSELFGRSADLVERHCDLLAERITALGGRADGTARIVAMKSSLAEFPLDAQDGLAYVAIMADRLAAFTKALRASIEAAIQCGDVATSALLAEITLEDDRQVGLLDAHLQAEH